MNQKAYRYFGVLAVILVGVLVLLFDGELGIFTLSVSESLIFELFEDGYDSLFGRRFLGEEEYAFFSWLICFGLICCVSWRLRFKSGPYLERLVNKVHRSV